MPNSYFQFKQFRIDQALSGMKVTTDGCLFGGWVASEIQKSEEPKRILDIGTGTGLLSLILAQVTSETAIDAIETNNLAFQEAAQNFQHSKWNDRLSCHHGSIQDLQSTEQYDVIICNPPFFKGSHKSSDRNRNEALHDSSLLMEDLLNSILRLLAKDGICYLLYPEREMNEFMPIAREKGLSSFQKVSVRNQVNGNIFRIMSAFGFEEMKTNYSELIIRNQDRKYTFESWELLKEYYLEYNAPQ